MIQISVIRTEGLLEEPLITILIDGVQTETLSKSEPMVLVKKHSTVQICCKLKKTDFFTSFHSQLLPTEGFQWIPLSKSSDTFFHEFPEEVLSPKVLVMSCGEVLQQIDESDEAECEVCETWKNELKKVSMELVKVKKNAKNQFDLLTAENEKNKLLVKKFTGLYTECKKELEFYKLKFEDERRKCTEVGEKLKNLSCRLEDGRNKENAFEWKKPMRPASTSPVLMDQSQNTLLKGSLSQTKLLHRKPLTDMANSQKSLKQTDLALRKYLLKTNRSGLITKDQSNNYKIGNKKVLISLKQGNLLCRVGGGFEGIEEFIAKNKNSRSTSVLDKNHRRHFTFDLVKQTEGDEKTESVYKDPVVEQTMKLRVRPHSSSFPDCP